MPKTKGCSFLDHASMQYTVRWQRDRQRFNVSSSFCSHSLVECCCGCCVYWIFILTFRPNFIFVILHVGLSAWVFAVKYNIDSNTKLNFMTLRCFMMILNGILKSFSISLMSLSFWLITFDWRTVIDFFSLISLILNSLILTVHCFVAWVFRLLLKIYFVLRPSLISCSVTDDVTRRWLHSWAWSICRIGFGFESETGFSIGMYVKQTVSIQLVSMES